jgi:circadian clock protein KaiB
MTSTNRTSRLYPGRAVSNPEPDEYVLTLFVSGASFSSARAVANIREICDAYVSRRHRLSIVDVNQEPALAEQHDVLATPTLVVSSPLPIRMLVGDMSDRFRVLAALDLQPDANVAA